MIGRLLTAMITPFKADESLALDEAGRLANWLIDQGNDGLVLAGTTGEAPTLSATEKLELFAAVREAIGTRGTIVANTGGNDTRASVALTKEAAKLGVDGILAVVPYYNKPTQDGMIRHFSAIAEATELPVIVYNVPGRTGANMQATTLLELARRHANIAGVKESSGDFAQFSMILRERRPDFTFWCGDDPLFLPSLALGGDGLISVASHLCARELKEMMDAFASGDTARAAEIHRRLSPMFATLFAVSNPIPVKWAMQAMGFNVGPLRSPLSPLPEALVPAMQALVADYLTRASAVPR